MFLTIIVFIAILGLLIFIHELGHFLIAKWAKIRVEEFAFGFPPRIASVKRGETRYAINLIPLGGYVKLYGEEEDSKDPRAYSSKPVWIRIGVVIFGVVMNFVLAIVLMTIGFMVGMTPLVSDPATLGGQKSSQVMVVSVEDGSAAANAGIKQGDIINGYSSASDLQNFTHSNLGKTENFQVRQEGQTRDLAVTLGQNKEAPLGVGVVSITKVKQNFFQAIWTSIRETGAVIATIFVFLWDIIKSVFTTGHAGEAAEGATGPVGLFNFTSAAIKVGWIYVLQLVIILSINLGIINALPFPALDGGKILFLSLEGIFRKKVIRQEVENIIHLVGFGLLILLMIAITYRDVVNLK